MALSLPDCFNVEKYSTHVLTVKYPARDCDVGSTGDPQREAIGVVRKGKRKRVMVSQCSATRDLHVNAAILATKSKVLDRLLNSEMQGEGSGHVVSVESEEEADLMCMLLRFCYSTTALEEVSEDREKALALLVLADQFDVLECMEACATLLLETTSSIEDASAVLNLSEALQQQECVVPLVELSRKTLAKQLQDLDALFNTGRHLSIPLEVLKTALGSSTSQVASENTCFCMVWGWVAENCKGPSARKAALAELLPLLKFHHMTGDFLLSICRKPDMTKPSAVELLREAIRYKMAQSTEHPGSFALSKVAARKGTGSFKTYSFEAVAESKFLQAAEDTEVGCLPELFIDGYKFKLIITKVTEGCFELGLYVNSWQDLQADDVDKVSLVTQVWFGSQQSPSWTILWRDCEISYGYSKTFRILASSGKSVQQRFLDQDKKVVFKVSAKWST